MTTARHYVLGLDLPLWDGAASAFTSLCGDCLSAGRSLHVCTVNPEIYERARRDRVYRRAVAAADVRTIDGIGIALAVWGRHGRMPQRLTGVMLTDSLALWAKDQARDVMIIGATEASRVRAESRLRERGVPVRTGSSPDVSARGESKEDGSMRLPNGGVVLVALGAPKQELWIRRRIEQGGPPNVYVGVGGAADYLSGEAALPPEWIRHAGLEWLYRLFDHPRRRLLRQRTTLVPFFWREILRVILARPFARHGGAST